MNPIPELTPALKQLRLSGILDSLEARNREAIDRKLAYTDFLASLRHGAYRVILDGDSYRTPKALPAGSKKPVAKSTKTAHS